MRTYTLPSLIDFNERLLIVGFKGLIKIPNNFTMKGTLSIYDCSNVGAFPDKTVIVGNLHFENCHIKRLPRRMFVGGNLGLSKTNVEQLPEYCEVRGSLDVTGSDWYIGGDKRFEVDGEVIRDED